MCFHRIGKIDNISTQFTSVNNKIIEYCMNSATFHICIGTTDLRISDDYILIDVSKYDRKIEIDPQYTSALVCFDLDLSPEIWRENCVLTMLGEFVETVECRYSNITLNMDKLPRLANFHISNISREQLMIIPRQVTHLSYENADKDCDFSLPNIKILDCSLIPDKLPPNLEKLSYTKYLDVEIPETLNEIHCTTGNTTDLPRTLESLSILHKDPVMRDICSLCPNLRNITIHEYPISGYNYHRNFDTRNPTVYKYTPYLYHDSEIMVNSAIMDNLPKSIQCISAGPVFSFADYDFSDFINLEKIRCAYSNFTPPPNLKTLVLDMKYTFASNTSDYCQTFVDNFFDKFSYIDVLHMPNVPLPFYNAIREHCIIGTLFLPTCPDYDIFDLKCRIIIKNTHGVEIIHSKSIVEFIGSPCGKYEITGDNNDIIKFDQHDIEYTIVSRDKITDISGFTVNIFRLIVPGEFVNNCAKSARK